MVMVLDGYCWEIKTLGGSCIGFKPHEYTGVRQSRYVMVWPREWNELAYRIRLRSDGL